MLMILALSHASSHSWGKKFQPLNAILADAPSDLQDAINSAVPGSTLKNQSYLGDFS